MKHVTKTTMTLPGSAEYNYAISGENRDDDKMAVLLQEITRGIHFRRLLEKSLAIVMKQSGADRGIIILSTNNHYTVEAVKDTSDSCITRINSVPLVDYGNLPHRFLQQVIENGKYYTVENPCADDYFKCRNINAVVCLPLINNSRIISLVYLENSITMNKYSMSRVKILKILTSQITITLNNSILHLLSAWNTNRRIKRLEKQNAFLLEINHKLRKKIDRFRPGWCDRDQQFMKQCMRYKLSSGEKETAGLLIRGCLYKEISQKMNLSINTIKERVKNIYKKCNVQNKVELTNLFNNSVN